MHNIQRYQNILRMKNKTSRLQAILEIIATQSVKCQEDFVKLLAKRGYPVTQATLSRDLKTLKVTKVATDKGSYVYIVPDSNEVKDKMLAINQGPASPNSQIGFVSLTFSGNIAVIKTRNGYAGGLAYDIDMSRPDEILGTIAGADTVFAVLKEDVTRERAIQALQRFIPINHNNLKAK